MLMVGLIRRAYAEHAVLSETTLAAYRNGYCDWDASFGEWLDEAQGELSFGDDSPLMAHFLLPEAAPKLIANSLINAIADPESLIDSFLSALSFSGSSRLEDEAYLEESLSTLTGLESRVCLVVIGRISRDQPLAHMDLESKEGWDILLSHFARIAIRDGCSERRIEALSRRTKARMGIQV